MLQRNYLFSVGKARIFGALERLQGEPILPRWVLTVDLA